MDQLILADPARPDVVSECPWCGGENTSGVCPKSITCPKCGVGPGVSCRRPSGHRAAQLHAARIELAESEQEGDSSC
jgi:hypothetical protein